MTEQQLDVGGPSRATRDNLVWNTEALSGHQIDSRLSGVDGDLFLKYFQVRVQTYSSRRYVFFALGLANSDSELWTAAGDNLSDALLGAAAAITIRVGDLSLTVPGPNHSSYSTADDSEPYHWIWDFPVTETGHPSRAVSDFLAGFYELSGEEQSRTQIVLSDQDVFTDPAPPPPPVLADAASVNLEEPLDLSSAGYNDVLRLGIKPSSEDQVFRIWATLAYSVEGSVASSRVGSRLVRNGDVNLSEILHPASSEMVRFAARTPKYFFVCDAPGTLEEVTYALSLFESEAAGASPRAQRGLSLYVEALSGGFEVVEKFVADSLPPDRVVTPPTPAVPGAISTLDLTVDDERTTVTGSWGESSDADEYKLVWKKAGTVASTVYVSTRTATFTDFTPGQRVELEVRGVNDTRGQEGPVKSESIGTSPPGPPPPVPGSISSVSLTINAERTTVTASWSSSSDADEYKLTWKLEDTGVVVQEHYVSGRSATLTNFTVGDVIQLDVRGVNDDRDQEGPVASDDIDTTPPVPGTILTLTLTLSSDYSTVSASWSESSDADQYKLVWYVDNVEEDSYTTTGRTDSFSTFSRGDRVKLEVRGVNHNGTQEGPVKSQSINVPAPPRPRPGTPPNLSATYQKDNDRIRITWGAGSDTNYYRWRHDRGTDSWTSWLSPNGTDREAFINSPVEGRTYKIEVRGYNDTGYGNSAATSVEVPVDPPPNVTGLGITEDNPSGTIYLVASWDAADRATSYVYKWKRANGSWGGEQTTEETSVRKTAASGSLGEKYYFRVKAKNSGGRSPDWTEDYERVGADVDLPVITSIEISPWRNLVLQFLGYSAYVSLDAAEGADYYKLRPSWQGIPYSDCDWVTTRFTGARFDVDNPSGTGKIKFAVQVVACDEKDVCTRGVSKYKEVDRHEDDPNLED